MSLKQEALDKMQKQSGRGTGGDGEERRVEDGGDEGSWLVHLKPMEVRTFEIEC